MWDTTTNALNPSLVYNILQRDSRKILTCLSKLFRSPSALNYVENLSRGVFRNRENWRALSNGWGKEKIRSVK